MSYWNFMMKETKKMNYKVQHAPSETKTYTTATEFTVDWQEGSVAYRLSLVGDRVQWLGYDSATDQFRPVLHHRKYSMSVPLEMMKAFVSEMEGKGL